MAKSRICYGSWLLASLILYLWSDSWMAFFLVIAALLLVPISLISTRLMKGKVVCSFEIKKMTAKKKSARGSLCLTNQGFLPIPRISCHLRVVNRMTGEQRRRALSTSLGVRGTQRLEWELCSDCCGSIRPEVEKIECFDFFGLFSVKEYPGERGQVLVLPDLFSTEVVITESSTANWESVTYSSVKKGDDPSEVFGIREYIEGDSLKNIHWKLSGKLDELYVKELSLPVENSIIVIYETGILEQREESPRVRDAMMETFLSVSQSLIEAGHVHALGWYDQKKERFTSEEITSEDDLTSMMAGLLGISPGENSSTGLYYFLQDYMEHPFAHVLYVTMHRPGEELDRLMQFCSVCVLQCVEKEEMIQESAGGMLVFTPDNREEALCQLLV